MKLLANNKRARFDYAITERLVAGLVLTGAEVKSIKLGHISLNGSYISFQSGEAYLTGAHVTPYQNAAASAEPDRPRKLLLHRRQLAALEAARQSGLSIVPLVVGAERGLVKVELGLGRGQKRYDKRARIKARETGRDIGRTLKNRQSK